MSATELCDLLEATHDASAFAINPGLADPADWASVAFKGGSDVGILNFSTYLIGKDGARYCIVATWNGDRSLSDAKLAEPYRGTLQVLKAGSN